jgi:Mor family transcriptional regulator
MEEFTREMLPEPHRRLSEVIGVEATIRLCEAYGGAPLYIPKLDALKAARRDERIRAEYDGMNTQVLARRYGVSRRTVQAVVSRAGRAKRKAP